ncbi:MAG: hypothetical protein H7067_10580 [Burkholderiales bacterium]|nr:hypothetical protein [Opitutaceae bacterium]
MLTRPVFPPSPRRSSIRVLLATLGFAVGGAPSAFAATDTAPELVLLGDRRVNFNRYSDGNYTMASLVRDFGNLSEVAPEETARHVIEKQALKLTLKAGALTEGGFIGVTKLKPSDECTFEFRVRFAPDFEWTKGGKLHGLSGGKGYAGGQSAADGKGWTVRVMWGAKGRLYPYVYHPDMPGKYGDTFGSTLAYAKPGQWYSIKYYIKVNTGEQRDGVLRIDIDGKTAFEKTDLRFATVDGYHAVDQLRWSCFFGGSGDDWRPTRDNVIHFDDFRLKLH